MYRSCVPTLSRVSLSLSLSLSVCSMSWMEHFTEFCRCGSTSATDGSRLPSLSELHWLPVQSRITSKIACLTYKVLTVGQPYYLRSLLHYYTPHRTLRSVYQRLLEQPRVSTELGKRSFSHLSPKTWNSLPRELRLALPLTLSDATLRLIYLAKQQPLTILST